VANFFITFAQGEGAELEEMLESTNFTIIDDVLSLPERIPDISDPELTRSTIGV
jgi:hypothetical protein